MPKTFRSWTQWITFVVSTICVVVLSFLPQPSDIESAHNAAEFDKWISCAKPVSLSFALGFDYLFMAAYVADNCEVRHLSFGCPDHDREGGPRGFLALRGSAGLLTFVFHGFESTARHPLLLTHSFHRSGSVPC